MKNLPYILFLLPSILIAQSNYTLNRDRLLSFEKEKNRIKKDSNFTTESFDNSCFKPYITALSHQSKDKSKNIFIRKIKKESLIIVNDTSDKFYMTIDPLLNFEFGKDIADTSGEKLFKNTRGFLIEGCIGNKFAFETSFYENQATYANYIDNYIVSTNDLFPQTINYHYNVVPGQGRSKAYKKNGYDYAMAGGYISYSPIKMLNIQVGNGKLFVGDGYRSLLLSDNTFNYPFVRITFNHKNFQYTNLYTSFMNLTAGGVETPTHTERLFQKKTGSFQMLSMNFFKRLQIGLFQGMIWEATDTKNKQHFNINTFDPIIGVNAGVYGLNNNNNILLGATVKFKITNSISFYGQIMLDDTDSKAGGGAITNKNGYQVGLKYFDLFKVKNLHLQLEYNSVRPYAYASRYPSQSYSHYNQPLAHPLGANFYEAIGFINYKLNDFFIEIKGMYAVKGNDSAGGNYGGNIFLSDKIFPSTQKFSTISTTQGMKTTIVYEDFYIGYLVNRATNFNIVLGFSNRTATADNKTSNTQFVSFGIRTTLSNYYFDF